MASLSLKLFYLRTREKKLSQRDVAEALGVRQATISNLEQGTTQPHWPLLVNLCKFYDVTPTYLADQERGVVPRATERWSLRDALVTLGMWVEVPKDAAHEVGPSLLCELRPGNAFFDSDALEVRRRYRRAGNSMPALEKLRREFRENEASIEERLRYELGEHPRRRSNPPE